MGRFPELVTLFAVWTLLVTGCQGQSSVAEKLTQPFAEGRLSADDPIGKGVPDLGQIDSHIPLPMLLDHTSCACPVQCI